MKYFLGVIAIIILFNIYDSHQEKKAEKLKKTITCMDFLKTDSPDCLDSPFNFVRKQSKVILKSWMISVFLEKLIDDEKTKLISKI